METDKRFKMHCFFSDYINWDDTINEYVGKFHKNHNVYPNILEANEFTLRSIDLAAQMHPDRIVNNETEENIEVSNIPYEGLSHFVAENYCLEMCLDFDLAEGAFTLIFDEDPSFDGLPEYEEEETEEKTEKLYVFKKSA